MPPTAKNPVFSRSKKTMHELEKIRESKYFYSQMLKEKGEAFRSLHLEKNRH
jgi:hypothetical protein